MLLRVKQLFWILFILFDLCVLTVVMGGIYYLESDEPRIELEKILSESLGRKVEFKDNLNLIFYPWIGVDTGPLTIGAAPDSESPHQLTVNGIDFKVRLLPLLFRDLEVDTIIVDSPQFHIERRKDGRLNLPSVEVSERESGDKERVQFFRSISVRGMSVLNATCTYKDVATGNSLKITGVNVRTGLLRKGTPLAFDISAMLDTDVFESRAEIDVRGLVDFSLQEKKVALSETSLSLKVESDELLGAGESLEGIASLDFNLVDGKIDVKGLVLQGAGVRLSGSATCVDIYHSPDFKGSLKSTRFDPKAVFSRFTPVPIPEEFKDILNTAAFEVDFHSTLKETVLSDMVLAVDQTVMMGNFSVRDYQNPWVEFDVLANSINLDPYSKLFELGSQLNGSAKVEQGKNESVVKEQTEKKANRFRDVIIADLVKKIPCNGRLEVGRLAYNGMRLENIVLSVSPGPKVCSLSIGKGFYLDGDFSLSADLAFDKRREKDVLYLNGKGAVSPFSLSNLPVRIEGLKFDSGKAGLNLDRLMSSGKTPGELVRNLKLDLNLKGQSFSAGLNRKEVPEQLRQLRAKDVGLNLTVLPVESDVMAGVVGRRVEVMLSGNFQKPAAEFDCAFNGDLFISRGDPGTLEVRNSRFDFSVGGEDVPVIKKKVSLSLAGGGSLRNGDLKLDRFSVRSGKIDLQGSLDAKRLGTETATAKGYLTLPKVGCGEIFTLLGVDKPETQDPKAFESVELDSLFELNGENLNLRVNKCSLDMASAQGTFELVDFKNPFLNFSIQADNVDVDRFLPPDTDFADKENAAANGTNPKVPEWQFPDELLGAINATGAVQCNNFRIFDFAGSKVSADVDMQNSVIDIHNLKADFHKGNLGGKISIGLRNGTVELGTDLNGSAFQSGLFFTDYVGKDYVNGLADASLKINGRSTANIDMVDTLSGDFAFKITKGAYLFASTTGKEAQAKKNPSPTKFSIMQGAVTGKDGKFRVKDYLLKTDYLTARAKGGFSFPDNSINLDVSADIIKLPNLYLKIVNAFLDAMTGVNVRVTGKLDNPKVEVMGLERWSDVLGDVLGLPEKSFMFFRELLF